MKSILLVVTAIVLITIGTFQFENQADVTLSQFQNWKGQHSKFYTPTEEKYRYQIYLNNLNLIQAHNQDSTQTYKMGENQFMDLTQEEFKSIYLNNVPIQEYQQSDELKESDTPVGKNIDWTNTSIVKNQGSCGSGWAFSVTGAIEAMYFIDSETHIDLSDQQLVDCERYSSGCVGGYAYYALQYAAAYGLTFTKQYQYTGVKSSCKVHGGATRIHDYKSVSGSISFKNALEVAPVISLVDADNWQFYSEGIFQNCQQTRPTHYVLVVGINDDGVWKVKNSWGTTWGEEGFIRLPNGNSCGIYNQGYQPIEQW